MSNRKLIIDPFSESCDAQIVVVEEERGHARLVDKIDGVRILEPNDERHQR
jgi:hypothetical protein